MVWLLLGAKRGLGGVAGRLAAALLVLSVFAGGTLASDYDLWYAVELENKRAGWMRSAQSTDAEDGRITTSSEMELEIRRGRQPIRIRMETAFVETAAGKPVSMRSVQVLGSQPVTKEYVFGPGGVTVTTDQAGQRTVLEEPVPEGVWLTPAAAAEYVRKRLEAGAQEITLRMVEPTSGLRPLSTTRRILESTHVEALGRRVPAFRTTTSVEGMEGVQTEEFIDGEGRTIRSTVDLGAFRLVILAADRELALSKLEPPELMQRTFVTPDRPIRNARAVRRGVYTLRVGEGEIPDLPSTPAQSFERIGPAEVRVTVDLRAPGRAVGATPEEAAEALGASAMISRDDPRVRELAARAAAKAKDGSAAAKAEAMRRFVFDFIDKKSLDVGFATASEVARSAQGDCSEHAVLLAAMLRAEGIPARTVSGLVYADAFAGSRSIFGYHMWTQALLERDGVAVWQDLDATLPHAVPFDATHIALAVSNLAEGEMHNSMVALVPLMGRLQIRVEATE